MDYSMKAKKQKQYILLKRTKTNRAGAVTPAESEDINMIKLADKEMELIQ